MSSYLGGIVDGGNTLIDGGTIRLPRIVMWPALEIILTGRQVGRRVLGFRSL